MTDIETLARARKSFEQRAWADAYRRFEAADREAPLEPEDLEQLATAELTRDILSQRQLEAVMTDFWANHFNVFAAKGYVRLFESIYNLVTSRWRRPRQSPATLA